MEALPVRQVYARHALLPQGWAHDVVITIGPDGIISDIETAASARGEIAAGPIVPAMPNVHSHAFQRSMAGLAEISGGGSDSFWTWREEMYRTVGLLSPDDIEAVAAKLYVELLKGGFSQIGEFHYLHHASNGKPYADPAETSRRIIRAAGAAGIGLTLLPVFYAHSNFGGVEPNAGQRPFLHDPEHFLRLLADLAPACADANAVLGLAIHSLRATTPREMQDILSATTVSGPIHIHIAEQIREVEDCIAWSGRRPVEWLLDEFPVDSRWCAIHATHMTQAETHALAQSGAIAGLCPATEANLGDGIFPAVDFIQHDGAFGIGTDSHIAIGVAEELRTLEYGQRLRDRGRNRLASGPHRSTGRSMFDAALAGGASATGQKNTGIRTGARADLVVLDGRDPYIGAAKDDQIIDRWLFALGDKVIRDVMVAGRWTIRDGRHDRDEEIDRAFAGVLKKLT